MKKLTHSLLIFQLIFFLGIYKTKPEADREKRRERESERDARIMAIESAQTNNKVKKQRAERMAKT